MQLKNLRRVLESQALSRTELIGFLVALFLDEDRKMPHVGAAAEARAQLARMRPHDRETQMIWTAAMDRIAEIEKTPYR